MSARSRNAIDDLMLQRIYGEFLEMPGLRLTCQQAQRLWGLDEQTCSDLLEFLVDARFLHQPRHGMYMRMADGHSDWPRPRMAKAGLDVGPPESEGRGMNAVNRDSNRDQLQTTETLDDDLELASRTGVPVLITAEGRDQRETCARLIHTNGGKGHGPFVSCLVDALAAGTEARNVPPAGRAHDDAVSLRQQFDQARGGTLFIDDITNLTSGAQAQLCCLLEEYSFQQVVKARAGAPTVRIIAGASRHLDAERATGIFCEPLFYRLNVIHFDLLSEHTHSRAPQSPSARTMGIESCGGSVPGASKGHR